MIDTIPTSFHDIHNS